MATKNIVILLSGNGSTLQAIIDAIKTYDWPIHIAAVISDKAKAYGLIRAQQAGITTHTIQRKDFAGKESHQQAIRLCIEQYPADLVVLAGFMRILTTEFVDYFHNRLLNIHPSLLPKYKGLDTYQRALDADEQFHGSTVHYVTSHVDGGPIIRQIAVFILPSDTRQSLCNKVQSQERWLYPQTIYQLLKD